MIRFDVNAVSPTFGRVGSPKPKDYNLPRFISRTQSDMLKHIDDNIEKATEEISRKSQPISHGVAKDELVKLFEEQNKRIGEALIAVLDSINGKKVDAYSVIQKNLLNVKKLIK